MPTIHRVKMAATTTKDLDKFLSNVDEFDSIMQSLVSPGDENTQEVLRKADDFIDKCNEEKSIKKRPPRDNTGVNRSVINHDAFRSDNSVTESHVQDSMNQEGFMQAMEADVAERSARKKESKKAATLLKDKGNEEYVAGNYEAAIEFYTQGLSLNRDFPALYTNRAQAYIKLGEYQKAIGDCDWAIRASEDCTKAYIHQGRAHLALKHYDEAIHSYNQALKVDPKKTKAIQTYISEAERVRKVDSEEEFAKKALEEKSEEALSLVELIKKVNKDSQLPIYYSGGLRLLAKTLNNADERTLFRINGGLRLSQDHPLISRLFEASAESLSTEELDICSATLIALTAACSECEENQRQLLTESNLCIKLLDWLELKDSKYEPLQDAAIALVHAISQTPSGSAMILSTFDFCRLLICTLQLMRRPAVLCVPAAGFLNNLALHKQFKVLMRSVLDKLLPALEQLLKVGAICNQSVMSHTIAILTNICTDSVIRLKLMNCDEIWLFCVNILEVNVDSVSRSGDYQLVFSVLGLLMNLTIQSPDQVCSHAERLCMQCCHLLNSTDCAELLGRVCCVLASLLQHSTDTVDSVCHVDIILKLLDILKRDMSATIAKPVARCFAACTKHNVDAKATLSQKEGLATLLQLLKHPDEAVVGNAALCLNHCCEEAALCSRLTKTSIILDLLLHANGSKKHSVRHNCAILIATLTKGDTRHLDRLRELNAHDVLLSVIQHTK